MSIDVIELSPLGGGIHSQVGNNEGSVVRNFFIKVLIMSLVPLKLYRYCCYLFFLNK